MCMSYHSEYLTALNIMTVGQLASSAAKYHIQIMLKAVSQEFKSDPFGKDMPILVLKLNLII